MKGQEPIRPASGRRGLVHRERATGRTHADEISTPPLDLERARLRDATYIGELLDIPRKTVLQYARDGRLPYVRLGKHVRFVVDDVERAIDRSRQPGQPL